MVFIKYTYLNMLNSFQKQREEEQYKKNMDNFFGCGESDWEKRIKQIEENKQPDPKSLVKN